MARPKLSDILKNGHSDALTKAWAETQAAEDFGPLPAGEYVADLIAGELFTSRSGQTPGYKMTFVVAEGPHAGRRVWHQVWLTPAALPMAKRDLGKLGIAALEQLEQPLPAVIRCRVKVALRKNDDGTEYNSVRSFDVVEILGRDPFAPSDASAKPEEDVAGDSNPAATTAGEKQP
jgi:hypothetical protein